MGKNYIIAFWSKNKLDVDGLTGVLTKGSFNEEISTLGDMNNCTIVFCDIDNLKYYNERYDGNGYPEGLSGNSIPLSTQIASVAIEYSNLINTITPVDYDRVASLIIMESGRKFNPKIVESFKKVMKEFEGITKVGE